MSVQFKEPEGYRARPRLTLGIIHIVPVRSPVSGVLRPSFGSLGWGSSCCCGTGRCGGGSGSLSRCTLLALLLIVSFLVLLPLLLVPVFEKEVRGWGRWRGTYLIVTSIRISTLLLSVLWLLLLLLVSLVSAALVSSCFGVFDPEDD